jgi:hypothetical protein
LSTQCSTSASVMRPFSFFCGGRRRRIQSCGTPMVRCQSHGGLRHAPALLKRSGPLGTNNDQRLATAFQRSALIPTGPMPTAWSRPGW